jgi:hypothetical protein
MTSFFEYWGDLVILIFCRLCWVNDICYGFSIKCCYQIYFYDIGGFYQLVRLTRFFLYRFIYLF